MTTAKHRQLASVLKAQAVVVVLCGANAAKNRQAANTLPGSS